MLSDEQFTEQIQRDLHAEMEVLKPSREFLDAVEELTPGNGRLPQGSVKRPAGRDRRRWRPRVGGLGAALPALAAVIVVVAVAAVALTSLRQRHSSTPAGQGIAVKTGQIALIEPGGGQPSHAAGVKPRVEFVNPDGSGWRYVDSYPCSRSGLSQGDCNVESLAWSPGGTQLAYLAGLVPGLDPAEYTLYLVGANGQEPRRLTACGDCQDVSWSPDGSQLAVARYVGTGSQGTWNVWVINAKTGAMRPITSCKIDACVAIFQLHELQWSSDGRNILFVGHGKESALSLDTIHPDGSHLTRLTTIPEPMSTGSGDPQGEPQPNPQWSPDGRKIAFNEFHGIDTISADGTDLKRLVANGANPAWSPDGRRLAYSTWKKLWNGARLQLWTINADGSGNRLLYQHRVPYPYWRPAVWSVQVWSPDGRQIAFSAGGWNEERGTWVINAIGTGLHRIGPDTGVLAWQPIPSTR